MAIFNSYVSLPEGIGNVIIPTDFRIFQRGWNHQPVIEMVDYITIVNSY